MPRIMPIQPELRLKVLSDDQLAEIKSATFQVLENVGVHFPSVGMLKASTVMVPEQIIFDDEIYHSHRVLLQGLDTNSEGLALDVISTVGPRGHFLAQRHTRDHIGERWLPELSHPRMAQAEQAAPDIRHRARAKLDNILLEHQPQPLDEAVKTELQSIMDCAEKELSM